MYSKLVEKLTDEQLKSRKGMCLGATIVFLVAICVLLFFYFTKTSNSESPGIVVFLGATFPILYGIAIDKEIKKRKAI